jgi:hypothetical protein
MAAGVLVVAVDEHGSAEEQVAPLVELGEGGQFALFLRLAGEAQSAGGPGLPGIGVFDPGQHLGGDAVAEVLLDHPAIHPDGQVVVAAAIAASFPGHERTPKRRNCGGVAQRRAASAGADGGRDRRERRPGRRPESTLGNTSGNANRTGGLFWDHRAGLVGVRSVTDR